MKHFPVKTCGHDMSILFRFYSECASHLRFFLQLDHNATHSLLWPALCDACTKDKATFLVIRRNTTMFRHYEKLRHQQQAFGYAQMSQC